MRISYRTQIYSDTLITVNLHRYVLFIFLVTTYFLDDFGLLAVFGRPDLGRPDFEPDFDFGFRASSAPSAVYAK